MTLTTDTLTLNEERHVTLTVMVQAVGGEFGQISRRPAVLILPGGGYSMCSDREAEVVAFPYLQAGYQAFVLRYSVGEFRKWPNPLDDYEQAMRMIRGNADPWHVDPGKIAVIGFSAGGHLAACAATMAENRPNAAILGYAAYSEKLMRMCQPGVRVPSPIDCVDENTCPCFLFAARNDVVVPIEENILPFEMALCRYGISFESHIYSYGGHGFGTADSCVVLDAASKRLPDWTRDSVGWLDEVFGQLTVRGFGDPQIGPKINGNAEPSLSVSCTVSYIKQQGGQAMEAAGEGIALVDRIGHERFGSEFCLSDYLGTMTLGDVLREAGMDSAAISRIDAALKKIPNKKDT